MEVSYIGNNVPRRFRVKIYSNIDRCNDNDDDSLCVVLPTLFVILFTSISSSMNRERLFVHK